MKPERPATVYVPDTEKLIFVSPGDRIMDANGIEKAIVPYKGLIMSSQKYMELLTQE